jgi:uncharacterized protein with FMN-binding domain
MRRVLLSLIALALGTALLVGLKSPRLSGANDYSAVSGTDPATVGGPASVHPGQSAVAVGSGNPHPPSGPAATAGSTTGPHPTTTAHPTSTNGQPVPTTTAPTGVVTITRTTTTSAPPASRTITGTAYSAVWNGDNYGQMQVQIVVTGTHIDQVNTIKHSSRPKTVATDLATQAIQSQSANVGNVSGATASSNAYKQSLASAIAQI